MDLNISTLENNIADTIFIKIENWNLYLGDAGLARKLAIECISNINRGPAEAAKLSLNSVKVKVGDGKESYPLIKFTTTTQIYELEKILDVL